MNRRKPRQVFECGSLLALLVGSPPLPKRHRTTGLPHSKTLSRLPAVSEPPPGFGVRQPCGPAALSKFGIEIVLHPHLINLEAIDALHLRLGCGPLEPRG